MRPALATTAGETGRNMASARDFLVRRPHLIPAAIAAVLLLLAVGKWPYAYYQIMRWAVCAAAVFVAYKGWTFKRMWAVLVFGFVVVLFNPLVPIHMKRDSWQVFDLLAAAIFVVAAVVLCQPKQERQGRRAVRETSVSKLKG